MTTMHHFVYDADSTPLFWVLVLMFWFNVDFFSMRLMFAFFNASEGSAFEQIVCDALKGLMNPSIWRTAHIHLKTTSMRRYFQKALVSPRQKTQKKQKKRGLESKQKTALIFNYIRLRHVFLFLKKDICKKKKEELIGIHKDQAE